LETPPRPAALVAPRQLAAAVFCSLVLACGSRTGLDPGGPERNEPPAVPTAPSSKPVAPTGGQPPVTPSEPTPQTEPTPLPCEAITLTIDELRPTVTLLVDQSGSMRSRFPTRESEQTRWSIVRQALLDPMSGVVRGLEQSMQFALAFYTSHNGFSSGTCPILSEVRAATGNYEAIRTLYDSVAPDDDTPTGAAIAQVVSEIQASTRQGPQVILLVTDGDPDTCEVPDPQTDAGQLQAIAAATAAQAADIDFYVLGISADISGDKLQQLANAGQGKRLDALWGADPDAAEPYQATSDVAGLTAQLRNILARVPLCEVALDRDVSSEEIVDGKVMLDGKQLIFGATDGFQLVDSRHLSITGKACDDLRAKGKRLSVRISCD
jgi:hypothetical protein